MGLVFGKINVETPDHKVVHRGEGYEVWRLPAQVAAVVYAKDLTRNDDGSKLQDNEFTKEAFPMLAGYIGVFKAPENKKKMKQAPEQEESQTSNEENEDSKNDGEDEEDAEKVAMTAPVVVNTNESEKVSMTAPVVVNTNESEKVSMTAPVVVGGNNDEAEGVGEGDENDSSSGKGQSMKFLLPAKFKSVEEAPIPTNKAVTLEMVEGGRCEAVLTYSGGIDVKLSKSKADELLDMLKRDNVSIVGDWTYQGYNPPFTLPWFKRNEIHFPVDPSPYENVSELPENTADGENK